MADSTAYKVVTTGQTLDGFDAVEVQDRLVTALRLKPEVAARFFEKPRVVKKDVSRASADKICAQLASIGVAAEVQSPPPPVEAAPVEPQRELPEGFVAAPSKLEIVDYEQNAAPKENTIECPNCKHVQAKAEQCESCGIWFHKFDKSGAVPEPAVAARTPAATTAAVASQAHDSAVDTSSDTVASRHTALSPAAIGAAVVAALIGAWVWKFVAVTLEFEFGLIAWGIGGAVGFAAAMAGARGVQAGIICGLLALASIGLGKYWAYSAFIDQFQETVAGVMTTDDEMVDYFEEEMADARLYVNGSGSDDFVRRFMVDRGYTDATSPGRVSSAEVADFREYIEPALIEMADNPPDFDEWQESSVEAIGEMSPWAMVIESLGLLDIVFAFLGIGTAYRLGSQEN
ncbi:MAG: hypothetical protein AAGI27_17430 [Pseudomonadota bacterium]